MSVVSYLTIDGEVISETRNEMERVYLRGLLGSTISLLSDNHKWRFEVVANCILDVTT